MTEAPQPPASSPPVVDEPRDALQGQLVRRTPARLMRSRLPRDLTVLRERVSQLARSPTAVATATVVTGLALNAAREVVKSGVFSRDAATAGFTVTGHVVHHVHVFHHVVHHHVIASTGTRRLPAPPGPLTTT